MKALVGLVALVAAVWAGSVIGGVLVRAGLSLWECLAIIVLYAFTVLLITGGQRS